MVYTTEWILRDPLRKFVHRAVDESKNKPTRQWSPEKLDRVTDGLLYLFKQGFETAFIARYKDHIHGGLNPEQIRRAMNEFLRGRVLNRKVVNFLSTDILKIAMPEDKQIVEEKMKNCKDLTEFNEIRKDFLPAAKKTKAEIAKELGLEVYAEDVLRNKIVDFASLVCKEMTDESIVKHYLKVCLADKINKDENVRVYAIMLSKQETKSEMRVKTELRKEIEQMLKRKDNGEDKELMDNLMHFDLYVSNEKGWEYKTIRSHQVSALNRCAEEKFLTWTVELPKKNAVLYHPFNKRIVHPEMQAFYDEAFNYSIDKFFIPKVTRIAKRYLNEYAEERSLEIFGRNTEQLFAQKGINSRFVIALDPGSMIKSAFLRPNGSLIDTRSFGINNEKFDRKGELILQKWADHCCNNNTNLVFAIGNGHNSYNTQKAVVDMIKRRMFPDKIDVGFCVVPECGASKYSCTPTAEEEFGNIIDIKEISAVSIGRRLIDPMAEYMKIEPKHIGKGQYQHSVNQEELNAKLVQVVRDRVSEIGADLNTASKQLLRQICGLDETTAAAIVKYREENGGFRSREELRRVDGITEHVFRMCSGFLTVAVSGPPPSPSRAPWNRRKTPKPAWNPLDATIVHPDDYIPAIRLLNRLGLTVEEATDGRNLRGQGTSDGDARIIEMLTKKPELRPPPPIQKDVPLRGEIKEGMMVTGIVRNVTEFGVFVDIGLENDGFCHVSNFIKRKTLHERHRTNDPLRKTDMTVTLPSVHDVLVFVIKNVKDDQVSLRTTEDFTGTTSEDQKAQVSKAIFSNIIDSNASH